MDRDELANRFRFHPATTDQRKADHEEVRNLLGAVAQDLNDLLPEGREKALVMTNLEHVMFWANAAIARQPDVDVIAAIEDTAQNMRDQYKLDTSDAPVDAPTEKHTAG